MKTAEELAEEYGNTMLKDQVGFDLDDCRWSYIANWEKRAFLAGYAAAQPKWISVMTKTPPIRNDGDETMLFLTMDEQLRMEVLFWDWMDWSNIGVTHWMPLPEAPKENE